MGDITLMKQNTDSSSYLSYKYQDFDYHNQVNPFGINISLSNEFKIKRLVVLQMRERTKEEKKSVRKENFDEYKMSFHCYFWNCKNRG